MPGAASRARLLYVNPTPGTPRKRQFRPGRHPPGNLRSRLSQAQRRRRAYPCWLSNAQLQRNRAQIRPPLRQPMWQIGHMASERERSGCGVSYMAEQPETQETRSAYLLDGRRVTIADLIGAGLLAPGDALRFRRPRVGQTHKAVVTARRHAVARRRAGIQIAVKGRESGCRYARGGRLARVDSRVFWPVTRLAASGTARPGGGRHCGRGRNGRQRVRPARRTGTNG